MDGGLVQCRVTVVVATLNEAASIGDLLAGLLGSGRTESLVEVIVVDGGSEDKTVAIAEQAGVKVIAAERGRGQQMNAGAAAASGDVLVFLHADCRLGVDCLEQVASAFAEPDLICACFRQRISANGLRYRLIEWGNLFRGRRLGIVYGDQAMCVRKAVFDEVGGFPSIPLMEDLELARRLKRKSCWRVLDGPVVVDARRWKRQGLVFSTLRNWCFVVLYFVGVSPGRLARWYRNVR